MARSGETEGIFAVYPVEGRPSRPCAPKLDPKGEGTWAISCCWCTRSHLVSLDRLLVCLSLRTIAEPCGQPD